MNHWKVVEWYAAQKNPGVKFNWTVGETAWTPGSGNEDGLRYMDDPTKDGYSIDNYALDGDEVPPRPAWVRGSNLNGLLGPGGDGSGFRGAHGDPLR